MPRLTLVIMLVVGSTSVKNYFCFSNEFKFRDFSNTIYNRFRPCYRFFVVHNNSSLRCSSRKLEYFIDSTCCSIVSSISIQSTTLSIDGTISADGGDGTTGAGSGGSIKMYRAKKKIYICLQLQLPDRLRIFTFSGDPSSFYR
jgi:hypothetical protein